jgi:hypothetical protein
LVVGNGSAVGGLRFGSGVHRCIPDLLRVEEDFLEVTMQLRIDPPNAKAIKALSKEYKQKVQRRKSYAAVGNELIKEGLEKRTLPVAWNTPK